MEYCIDTLPAWGGRVALGTEVVEPKGQVGAGRGLERKGETSSQSTTTLGDLVCTCNDR